jgi:ribonuclease E
MTDDQELAGATPPPPTAPAVPPTAEAPTADTGDPTSIDDRTIDDSIIGDPTISSAARKRRRGSRGGKNRKRPGAPGGDGDSDVDDDDADDLQDDLDDAAQNAPLNAPLNAPRSDSTVSGLLEPHHPELPERLREGRPSPAAAEAALVRRPQIGDTRPAPAASVSASARDAGPNDNQNDNQNDNRNDNRNGGQRAKSRAKSGGGRGQQSGSGQRSPRPAADSDDQFDDRSIDGAGTDDGEETEAQKRKRRRGGRGRTGSVRPETAAPEMDPAVLELRRGRERNGRPIGRYLMCVQVRPTLTQVAVLEGRTLIEHYVSRPADDVSQIHGNIYVGKVQNVLPGMEAAFVDIGTPKNAVLYRGDVQYEPEDIVEKKNEPRIEQMLRAKQLIVCQVTKSPIGLKGARLTQEVSLPGRFVVLIPNSKTYGISKRLPDDVRKRLRNILDRVKPAEHGLIVRTAAEHATEHELRADMTRLLDQWNAIEAKAKKSQGPTLLYREPELAVRVIREEFNSEYRGVVIDDQRLHDDVKDYVGAFNPELADRVEFYDSVAEGLPMYERFHIHEQLHKALDRKVWLPSGGSLIIEHTEALTVIDVNTGKNVGTTNLEETVFRNNLEAAGEVAKQLRLRDIGGIVVIDFIDMEIKENRRKVVDAFRTALSRDKTRTQVFDITELGLVEMTRKRIGEGLLVNFADRCPNCDGRGLVIDHALLE